MAPVNALSHVSVGTNDFPSAKRFYDAVLGALEIRCVMEFDEGAGYGREFPEFWVQLPFDGAAANPGNGVHVCFNALSQAQVNAFHKTALEMGAEDEGKPGFRKEYTENYYAAFVRDLDGHKIEAMCMVKKQG
jgi:catechol 2,3-dioxygenase-like lactoylglutathione lyase family enzyme